MSGVKPSGKGKVSKVVEGVTGVVAGAEPRAHAQEVLLRALAFAERAVAPLADEIGGPGSHGGVVARMAGAG